MHVPDLYPSPRLARYLCGFGICVDLFLTMMPAPEVDADNPYVEFAAFLLEESSIEDTSSLKLTHETIANHLGTHREVITRLLRYFQNEGAVRLHRGTIELADVKILKEIAEK